MEPKFMGISIKFHLNLVRDFRSVNFTINGVKMKKRKNIVHTSCPNYNTKMSKNVKRYFVFR